MNTIKINSMQTKMIAHRGVSKLERENTTAAFLAAGNRSYFGIETDVHKTADGQFVAIHDSMTGRVTNGVIDVEVEQSDYEMLKTIVLPDLDGSTHREDLRIPLLLDYIKVCKKYEKTGVLEIKELLCKEDLQQIVDIIRREEYLEHIIFISFEKENCIRLRELLPEQPIQWLTMEEVTAEMKEFLYQYGFDLDIHHNRLSKELIQELHGNQVSVNCWTCDDAQRAAELIQMGVDYITSNILE